MKVYSIAQLKKIAKDQGYKTACLETSQGDKALGYNQQGKTDVLKQLQAIEKRLEAEILPNGNYYVCLAHNIPRQKNPDKYLIQKGENIPLTENTSVIHSQPTPEVLTWSEALKLHQELAQLREENNTLKKEKTALELRISELENEELEEEGGPLPVVDSLGNFLKEQSPTILGALDKYFETKNRALDIEEKKIGLIQSKAPQARRTVKFEPGSPHHLTLIEHYYNKGMNDKLNEELDKLEAHSPEKYKEVMTKLNIAE